MFDKHYMGQGYTYRSQKVDRVVTVRLSWDELVILDKYYHGKSVSFGIRSAIHALEHTCKNVIQSD